MENRDTITIETPVDKHSIILNAYITGREKRNLYNFIKTWQVELKNEGVSSNKMNLKEMQDRGEEEAIKMIVVSMDASAEDILNRLLDMKSADYTFVVKKVNEILDSTGFLDKAQTETKQS